MESFWDRLKNGIREGAAVSAEKVEVYSKIGKLKIEQFNNKKAIKKYEHELGVLLYHLVKNDKADTVSGNDTVVTLVTKIDAAKDEIEALSIRIAAVKSEKEKNTSVSKDIDSESSEA